MNDHKQRKPELLPEDRKEPSSTWLTDISLTGPVRNGSKDALGKKQKQNNRDLSPRLRQRVGSYSGRGPSRIGDSPFSIIVGLDSGSFQNLVPSSPSHYSPDGR